MAELDPGLQEEADQASIDFAVAYDSDAPLSRDDAFIAGFKAAAESRDQRIKGTLGAHRWEANLSGYGGWCSCNSTSMGWNDYIDHLMMALKRAEPR